MLISSILYHINGLLNFFYKGPYNSSTIQSNDHFHLDDEVKLHNGHQLHSLQKWASKTKTETLDSMNKNDFDFSFVLGNEASDLDSVASTVGLAYFLDTVNNDQKQRFVPLIQRNEDTIDLRKEIKLALGDSNISHNDVLTLDELPLKVKELAPKINGIYLVDHNNPVNDWELAHVRGVIDHHKQRGSNHSSDANPYIIEHTKSCTSLVTREISGILKEGNDEVVNDLSLLLLSAIALDTKGLTDATDVDIESARTLYKSIFKKLDDKKFRKYVKQLFKKFKKATKDLDHLNFLELLMRDYKGDYVENKHLHRLHVGYASIPISIEEQIKRTPSKSLDDYRNIERNFMVSVNSDINFILSKHKVKDNERDEKIKVRELSVLVRNDDHLNEKQAQIAFDKIVNAIETHLDVRVEDDEFNEHGKRRIWVQNNEGVGRKIVRPVVENALKDM